MISAILSVHYLVPWPSCLWCDPVWRWRRARTPERSAGRAQFAFKMCNKGHSGFLHFYPTAVLSFLSSLTFTQNQMVMGKRRAVKRPDTMTMNHPMHPSDPVRSAGDRKRQRCVFECVWHTSWEESFTIDVNITLDVYCCKSAQGIIMTINQFETTSDPFGSGGDVFLAPM